MNDNQEMTWQRLRKVSGGDPLSFSLTLTGTKEQLFCHTVLRWVPGKRMVISGTWGEKEVVAKLFFERGKANMHMVREIKGVNALVQSGILTPILYYQGAAQDKRIKVALFEKIVGAISPLSPPYRQVERAVIRMQLRALTLEFATQHVLGILQKDMHFNNFLLRDDKIYVLDGSDIVKADSPLSKAVSLDNLALFVAQLGVEAIGYQEDLLQTYARARGWILYSADVEWYEQQIKKWQESRLIKFKKKMLRTCTAFVKRQSIFTLSMVNRFDNTKEWVRVCANPEMLFSQPKTLLKEGRTSTVIQTTLNQRAIVVKRYNMKNIWHRLRRCMRPTRAMKSWRLSQYLMWMGVPTARPIGFIEKRFFGLRGKSYFMMELVTGQHSGDYFADASISHERKLAVAKRISALFNKLSRLRIIHGDLKMTNILIHDDEPILIDLDGMRIHTCRFGFQRAFQKEMKRFLRNWRDNPVIYQLLEKEFHNVTC